MSNTNFSNKCNIMGSFWLEYREDAESSDEWSAFFSYNDVSLPLAFMLMGDVPLARINVKSEAKKLIEETWDMICEFLNVDKDAEYTDIKSIFDASPNGVLSEEESEEESE